MKKEILIRDTEDGYKEYYNGETLNGEPHGKGFLELYSIDERQKKVHKIDDKYVGKYFRKKYQKNFKFKAIGMELNEKYIGKWKNGYFDGQIEHIVYCDPDHFVGKDGSPAIECRYIGNYKKFKKEGKFHRYTYWTDHIDCEIEFYKNGKLIRKEKGKSIKRKKKDIFVGYR